jgi:hypothetical protein
MPVLRNGNLARKKTREEILKEIRVGDTVSCLLHPAGPGTEEYRRSHGHECELKILAIEEAPILDEGYFTGEFFIEDLDALMAWISMMDNHNDGSQIRETKIVPEIPLYCIEEIVERAVPRIDDEIAAAIETLAETITHLLFERREPGSVLEDEWKAAESGVKDALIGTVEHELMERSS